MTERFYRDIELFKGGGRAGKSMATRCYNALDHLIRTRDELQRELTKYSDVEIEELLQTIEPEDKNCPLPLLNYSDHTRLLIPHSTLTALKKALDENPNLLYTAAYQWPGRYVPFGPDMMASISFGLSTLNIDRR